MLWIRALAVLAPSLLVCLASYFWLKYRIDLIRNQFAARHSACLEEALELHDRLLQDFQGLTLRMHAAMENVSGNDETKLKMESILAAADTLLSHGRGRARMREDL